MKTHPLRRVARHKRTAISLVPTLLVAGSKPIGVRDLAMNPLFGGELQIRAEGFTIMAIIDRGGGKLEPLPE